MRATWCVQFQPRPLTPRRDGMSTEESNPPPQADCFACKMTGALGCFAGATYALYQRAQLPPGKKNRHWLTALGIGGKIILFVAVFHSFCSCRCNRSWIMATCGLISGCDMWLSKSHPPNNPCLCHMKIFCLI